MPKFSKGFGRRKSTLNELHDSREAGAESSFKVFEREDPASTSFHGGRKLGKATTVPPPLRPKTSVLDDDNMFENIYNRDSGASNTNTMSTTDNSSRLSAASTAPSSTDVPRREDWKSPHDKPFSDIPVPPVPKTTSAFSLKNAGRTLSWGRHKSTSPLPAKETPPDSPGIDDSKSSGRERAVTASSYASTATPPKLEEKDLGLSLGGDFSDMFGGGFGTRRSVVLDTETNRALTRSPETVPPGPVSANRSLTASRFNQPSPLSIDRNKEVEPSPYSWSSQHSHDGLMGNSSPAFARHNTPPPVPPHTAPRANDNASSYAKGAKSVGAANASSGLQRSSAIMELKRKPTLEFGDAADEDARLLRESMGSVTQHTNEPGHDSRVHDSWTLPSTTAYKIDDSTLASWGTGSDTTPKAKKPRARKSEENMFDVQIAASAGLAQRFNDRSLSPPTQQNAPQHKVMTPAQFERYKQDQERLRTSGGPLREEEEEEEEEPYDDDEDEAEKNKQLAKQRRKQEAHMAVYRQQMMKVTGEAIPPPRPSVLATQSSPNLALPGNAEEGEEEDEEVPLAILQAHGFPNKGKQPMRSMGSNPNLRSSAGGVVAGTGGGNLPVFARNLPQDPYVGAGLVNPMHRESLQYGGGAGSVSGEPPRGLPPGGLVGVIATEERSRAMRRGSPNPQGGFGASTQGGGFNPMVGMQPPAAGSLYNGMGPAPMGGMGPGGMGYMPPMMISPGDQAQIQMSQQMSQFMAMQMQFMQLMTTGGQSNSPTQMLSPVENQRPGSAQQTRPGSAHLQGASHQRAMTLLDPNAVPWMNSGGGSQYSPSQGGYAPSIAPSERSNVGLPGRYRPVSQAPPQVQHNNARTSTMSGALHGWGDLNGVTIKAAKKPAHVSDEDDDEAWAAMKQKREQKKSIWRTKKGKEDTNGIPSYAL
ncbi:hypothetical protein LZ554_002413 [Drepanopeziza brunnea f. sp. 'monogermtubi']|nr:hypothetical protein LZ554_002413 [Drepanopeziza brunnea f. sp. 'monogermtubi']